jgi:hypothetical protein
MTAFYACGSSHGETSGTGNGEGGIDATVPPPGDGAVAPDGSSSFDSPPPPPAYDASYLNTPFCELPGSLVTTASGVSTVPGASLPDISYIHVPVGFCVHYFAKVPAARQIRFAPGGELFVASPNAPTVGGGSGGLAAIQIVPDDNHDGVGDAQLTFMNNLAQTQGLLFVPGRFSRSLTRPASAPPAPSPRRR